jgi:UDP-glucose 4-epimerase
VANILITGGAGFIAGALAARLAEDPANFVVIIDNLITGQKSRVPLRENIVFVRGDVNEIRDIQSLFSIHKFDYVFHYAALVGVKRTLDNPVSVLRDIDGIRNIMELSVEHKVKRVFYSSSSEVYGEPVHIPQNEHTTPLNSRLPYAIVKNLGEAFLKSYQKEYGLDYTVFRFFNTYGPGQSEDFVVTRFIRAALEGRDITVYGDGMQTRTFCFIDDNVEVCAGALGKDVFVNDVVNVGSDDEVTILDLAKLIISLTGSESKIVHLPPLEEGDMTRRKPDNAKMRDFLRRDLLPLESGLREIIRILS